MGGRETTLTLTGPSEAEMFLPSSRTSPAVGGVSFAGLNTGDPFKIEKEEYPHEKDQVDVILVGIQSEEDALRFPPHVEVALRDPSSDQGPVPPAARPKWDVDLLELVLVVLPVEGTVDRRDQNRLGASVGAVVLPDYVLYLAARGLRDCPVDDVARTETVVVAEETHPLQ